MNAECCGKIKTGKFCNECGELLVVDCLESLAIYCRYERNNKLEVIRSFCKNTTRLDEQKTLKLEKRKIRKWETWIKELEIAIKEKNGDWERIAKSCLERLFEVSEVSQRDGIWRWIDGDVIIGSQEDGYVK